MVKTFRCADLGLPCQFEMKAEGEMELMKGIEGHVRTIHAMNPNLPEVREKLKKVIK
jgi:predicted small metal-binding protein